MSELKVDTIVNLAGTGKPNLPVSPTLGGAALSSANTYSYTSSGTEPSSPKNGAIWWDSSNNEVYLYIAGEFKKVTLNASAAAFSWGGDRGIVFGTSSSYNDIMYFNIAGSGGGSANFGDMTLERSTTSAGGSASRVLMGGGYGGSANSGRSDIIDYITPSSPGNATDFGNLTAGRNALQGISNGTRCLFAGGYTNGQGVGHANWTTVIDYVTIATTGNAASFGNLTALAYNLGGTGAGDGTRGLFMGGIETTNKQIEYVTYATTGNSADFGDLIYTVDRNSACSDATRSVSFGGAASHSPSHRNIEYVTTQTLGNATDFGNLTNQHTSSGSMSNGTIAIAQTGIDLEKVTIQTTGNATDFGDLLESRTSNSASSGSPS
tara:strand:+ start:390 stop:1526 length:1137 start_codon:yes stop_codon:yes gene_type:complete